MTDLDRLMYIECASQIIYMGKSSNESAQKLKKAADILKAIYANKDDAFIYHLVIIPMEDATKFLFCIEVRKTTDDVDEAGNLSISKGIIKINKCKGEFKFDGIDSIDGISTINSPAQYSPVITTPYYPPSYPNGPSDVPYKPIDIYYGTEIDPALRSPFTCNGVDYVHHDSVTEAKN